MTKLPADRPPFDDADAEIAATFLRERQLTLLDPFVDAAKLGDRIFTTTLSSARLFMADTFGATRTDGTAFRAYPFIVGRPSANAFAVERQGVQLCGLDVGLVTAAFEISLFVFSRTTLFLEIGDASAEVAPNLPAGSQLAFWMADVLRENRPVDAEPVGIEMLPRDPQRGLAVHLLTQLMLRFVWLHELYHCVNGHTGVLACEHSGLILNEMADNASIGLIEVETMADTAGARDLQHAMEYDADRSALWMSIHLQQTDSEPIVGLQAWPKPLRLKLALFAAVLMTFLFDQAARRQERHGITHPAARYRLADLVRTLASHLTEPPSEVKPAFQAMPAEMDALHREIPQFASAVRLLDDLHSATLQAEMDRIEVGLISARERFKHFAYHQQL